MKEIEENNRMGKTTDLFKKIRDTKGTFHTEMGSRKDRNGMELTEAEDILKILLVALRGAKMKSQAPGAVVFLSDPRLTKLRISPSVFR